MVWIYRGFFIVPDLGGGGYNVRTRLGEIIEEGCSSVLSARLAIDDHLKREDS